MTMPLKVRNGLQPRRMLRHTMTVEVAEVRLQAMQLPSLPVRELHLAVAFRGESIVSQMLGRKPRLASESHQRAPLSQTFL